MYTHRLAPNRHAHLFEEQRFDPITGEVLKAGDKVVFCACCHSAFLDESWEYIGRRHCNQNRTLAHVPTQKEMLALKKRTTSAGYQVATRQEKWERVMGVVVILFIAALLFRIGSSVYADLKVQEKRKAGRFSIQTDFEYEKRTLNRGDYYAAEGNYPFALQAYEEILEYNPNYQLAKDRIAGIRNALDRAQTLADESFRIQAYDDARVYYEQALRYAPEDSRILGRLDEIDTKQAVDRIAYLRLSGYKSHEIMLEGKRYWIKARKLRDISFNPVELENKHKDYFDQKGGVSLFYEHEKRQFGIEHKDNWVVQVHPLEMLDGQRGSIQNFKDNGVYDASLREDGKEVILQNVFGEYLIFDLEAREVVKKLKFSPASMVVWQPRESKHYWSLAIRENAESAIYEYQVANNDTRIVSSFRTITYPKDHLATLSPDGKSYLTVSPDGVIRVYDLKTERLENVYSDENEVGRVGFSTDGKYIIASSGVGGAFRVWKRERRKYSGIE
ncbi:MAG: hypothetical protein AAF740_09440 [Bacteroidota bacterium]